MVGYNDRTYTRIWHRGASCPARLDEPCDISVAYSDAPCPNTISGALLWNPVFEDFPEDARGRNTTVVSLENNMAVPMLFAAVEAQGVSYSECLHVQASHWLKKGVCRQGRPAKYPLGPKQANDKVDPEFQGIYTPKTKPNDRVPPPPPPAPQPLVQPFG
jgi:hypothetical protein